MSIVHMHDVDVISYGVASMRQSRNPVLIILTLPYPLCQELLVYYLVAGVEEKHIGDTSK